MTFSRNTITLDFETYFDNDYTLKKRTTTCYVRDPRFKVHGVSILEPGSTCALWLSDAEFRAWVTSIDWTITRVIAHNTAFDGFILSQIYGIFPAFYYDTLSMARALLSHDIGVSLNELAQLFNLGHKIQGVLELTKGIRDIPPELYTQLGEYACMDVQLTKQLFDLMSPGFPTDELELINITIGCFCDPRIVINKRLVQAEILWQQRRRKRMLQKIAEMFDIDDPLKALGSNTVFADMLYKLDIIPPIKQSPTNPDKEIYAFAKSDYAFIQLLEHPDKNIAFLANARLNAKSNIDRTRAERVLEHSKPTLPLMYHYARAHTLRWSGGDRLNPQNFRRRGRLRRAMEAPDGYQFVSIDSGQIENRMTMMLAEQDDVLRKFRNKEDTYKDIASNIYKIPVEEVTSIQRFVGKVSELGLQYGCGAYKLHHILSLGLMGPKVNISLAEATNIVDTYRAKRSKVVALWAALQRIVTSILRQAKASNSAWSTGELKPKSVVLGPLTFTAEQVLLPNGLALFYKDLIYDQETGYSYKAGKDRRSKIYGGLLLENIVQCLSRILVGEQILKIAKRYKVIMMTHDECGFLALDAKAQDAAQFALECFTTPPVWMPDIPLAAEVSYAKYYSK